MLAYAVSSTDAAKDGVFVRRTADGSVTPLKAGRGVYKSVSFDEAGRQIAFLSDTAEYDKRVAPYRLYYWKVGDTAATEVVSASTRGIASGMVVSDNFAPRFSEDGARLYLGDRAATRAAPRCRTRRQRCASTCGAPATRRFSRCSRSAPRRSATATTARCVHLSDKRVVQLATPDLPNVNPGADPLRSLGTSDVAYQKEMSWDTTYNDVYLVDLKNGQRKKVLEHYNGANSMSPGGNYLIYFDEPSGHWFTYQIATGTRVNLTERLPVKFFDEGHDTPDLAPSLGVTGWTDGDKSVLLNDQFDIWEIRPDGTNARMVTAGEGRKQKIVFRYRSLDPDARTVPANKPLLLAATNDETKASGYYRVNLTGTAAPEKIIMLDKQLGAPTKAKRADTVVFTQSRFDEFPDLWISDVNFASPKKVSNANPQQADYIWGKAENIKYINTDGKIAQRDADQAGELRPDEEVSDDGLHLRGALTGAPRVPRAQRRHAASTSPGTSATATSSCSPTSSTRRAIPDRAPMKCVIPAIQTVMQQGYIDPKRIGIQGHSWGGYQITYMITQTDIFAAVQAGASVSNMISAYGGIRWGTGMVRQFQYEKTQSRIGAPPWDAPLQFIENSPIFWVERINTPYLSIHNDGDDAVPWYQGIEFNTAMRRLGKEAYMFNYNGEPHGLRNRDNMKHWTVHMDEFFDHYLLGKPRPAWMDKGVSYLERGTRDVSLMFKKQVVPPAPGGRN